ncbi:MAG TPA: HlyC/CorC family transporter [Candidatus Faecousia excrementipullorum]|nr:HlyC/CorC family transporter [Candidatus Faecousia excrementipullorum]
MLANHIPSLLGMVICIILSGYFSATETAFSSLNKTRIKYMAEKGSKRAKRTLQLADNYDKLIATILIGNNIVNITTASIGTLLFVDLMGQELGATVSTVVVTIVVLIFGEITPKSIAKDYPERFAMFSAPMIGALLWLFTPLNFLFSLWKKLVALLFHSDEEDKMSQEELLLLLEEVEQEGAIDKSEGTLLRNAVEFGDLEVQSILTHRVDLEAVEVNATKEEIAAKFTETRFSRLLVYEETIDKIVGVLHLKDFYDGMGINPKPLREIMTPPLFIHQTEKVDDLLQLLKSSKSHIAVVIDEYGGTLGIVTMEDILEELVGEIWDEHDEVEEPFRQLSENTYLVDCTVTLDDFCDFFDVTSDSESVSLGGWIMDQMQRIPEKGDQFTYENLTITATEIDDHRIEWVTVEVAPKEDNEEE